MRQTGIEAGRGTTASTGSRAKLGRCNSKSRLQRNMKICYLILAHNNPNHFHRVVNAIATPNTMVFVHVCKSASLEVFQQQTDRNNVVFIKDRVLVGRFHFSMVQATLNLLKEALANRDEYDYFCLLSGSSDYPLKSPAYIEGYLKDNNGKEFINMVEMPDETSSKSLSHIEASKPLNRIEMYHLFVTHHFNNVVLKKIARKVECVVRGMNIKRPYKDVFKNMKPYGGSQWWMLTRPAVEHIMEFIVANPRIVKFFKNTGAPDESFFQTIIGNSSFRTKVTRNFMLNFIHWKGSADPYLTFKEWETGQREWETGQREWETGQQEWETGQQKRRYVDNNFFANDTYGQGQLLFARKFSDDSKDLTEFIKRTLW